MHALLCLLLSCTLTYAQQQIEVKVSPTIDVSINGELELDRSKYFNLASSSSEIAKYLKEESKVSEYIDDLEMSVGRQLGMVYSETRWGKGLKEDPQRPGYMDTDYFISQMSPNDENLAPYKAAFGTRQGLVTHDRHTAFPDFMETYTKPDEEDETYPTNNDAAAEVVAHILKYKYSDFQRPSFFELVNEPHWKFWDDPLFAEFHVATKNKVEEMQIDTEVGGPCYSVSYFYKDQFKTLNQITKFIDATNFDLDFYSFHTYDYMHWDDGEANFKGAVSSGLPLESVMDALASYTYNTYGKELTYVGSEHGGYISNVTNRNFALDKLADQYFPGEGFDFEMEKRAIDNFIMVNSAIANTLTFMNHPHIVKKSVPFILIQSANWDPYYYSSLLVKENFDMNSNVWAESRLIDYYKFFANVRGRRIESFTKDTDIQHMSFVNGKTLAMVFHNQSDIEGTLNIDIDDISNPIAEIKVRKLERKADFRPDFKEQLVASVDELNIGAQGSMVVFVTYENEIVKSDDVNEVVHYYAGKSNIITGSKLYSVEIPDHKKAKYGILRVGVSRKGTSKEMKTTLNGWPLEVPIEDCADRITNSDDDYSTTKIIKVDGKYLTHQNKIEVTFPDGKSGGIGSVAIRAALMDTNREEEFVGEYVGEPVLNANDIANSILDVYPNPAENQLNVRIKNSTQLHIFNILGENVQSLNISDGINRLDISSFAKGQYILQLLNEEELHTRKVIIK
ncbi:MAG: T9SS type A sorting domain-containing protein [Reichenbachiella sp.]